MNFLERIIASIVLPDASDVAQIVDDLIGGNIWEVVRFLKTLRMHDAREHLLHITSDALQDHENAASRLATLDALLKSEVHIGLLIQLGMVLEFLQQGARTNDLNLAQIYQAYLVLPPLKKGEVLTRQLSEDPIALAMCKVPRQIFVPIKENRHLPDVLGLIEAMGGPPATYDGLISNPFLPADIGHRQTNSAAILVHRMLRILDVQKGMTVLDCGAGTGHGSAILSSLVGDSGTVHGVEIIEEHYWYARIAVLLFLGFRNAQFYRENVIDFAAKHRGAYDRIYVAAKVVEIPVPLMQALKVGGAMILPVKKHGGAYGAQLHFIRRRGESHFETTQIPGDCDFVPLVPPFRDSDPLP